jgi:hypothetical protein
MVYDLDRKQAVRKRDEKEKNSENNRCNVELFLNTTAGAVEASVPAKGEANACAARLNENGGSKQNRKDYLSNIENHSAKSIPNPPVSVK